ncbi:uncharacterized protein GGS25DRAFT_516493 [Hypoxylon fragiforme]|uniref:uncharacterized protein n=1 Tax=Hypoxylon fragiforme TaxID=63214 RepID=UPI0020C683CD|nr:uncharacterized protein GGS25DRAFT_516493 [Hypoxylon fragiforme]KAI2613627.1 hypothetical protein GGS25DRAFT_516493 [Hypoxylon fragiforme]
MAHTSSVGTSRLTFSVGIGDLLDHPAFDDHGDLLLSADGQQEYTHSMRRIINLALFDQDTPCHNADSISFFAAAMFISKWNWESGEAKSYEIWRDEEDEDEDGEV